MSFLAMNDAIKYARKHANDDGYSRYVFKANGTWHIMKTAPVRGRGTRQLYYAEVPSHGKVAWFKLVDGQWEQTNEWDYNRKAVAPKWGDDRPYRTWNRRFY